MEIPFLSLDTILNFLRNLPKNSYAGLSLRVRMMGASGNVLLLFYYAINFKGTSTRRPQGLGMELPTF